MDYTEYGGAGLFGLNSPVIKAHGSSNANAILNAIRQARTMVEYDVCGTIRETVGKGGDAMTKVAFIFPGQGSQTVGMGEELAVTMKTVNNSLNKRIEVLHFRLSQLIIEGPQEELTLTYNAQPALLTVGAMIAARLVEEGITPDYTAGHSLGEYTALVASGVLSFEDGVLSFISVDYS